MLAKEKLEVKLNLKNYKSYPLMHCTEDHARPVIYKKERHHSFAGYLYYPVFLDTNRKEVRIATDFIVIAPKIYVKSSIPFKTSYPLTEMYIQ